MGYKEVLLKLPTDYSEGQLKKRIEKEIETKEFSYVIEKKSLDARKKDRIHWQVRVLVSSDGIEGDAPVAQPALNISHKKRDKKVVVVGSGPAGFFSALCLQKAGFNTTIIERGADVDKRDDGIKEFEATGVFNPVCNYAFGEGGAGTFSDGKLTSRSKRIGKEKQFILSSYVSAGAPKEIMHMTHPHLGSDNLKRIVKKLREEFLGIGGTVLFETLLQDLKVENGVVQEAVTSAGAIDADEFVVATGHSAYETYRMLIKQEVKFRTKSFAIGARVEHPQVIINKAQWGRKKLPGVKAAEYRLASKADGNFSVYTFCMCPGGRVVSSAAYGDTNTVNGMSKYRRSGEFANAGCVAGIDLNMLTGSSLTPFEALAWVEALERKFYEYSGGFKAPACTIRNFVNRKLSQELGASSYSLGITQAPLWELLPLEITNSIAEGLKDFSKKIEGFDLGNIMGLESKTSSAVQVEREESGECVGFRNLYMVGEGSGWAGGIVSSAADGIKAAINIVEKYS